MTDSAPIKDVTTDSGTELFAELTRKPRKTEAAQRSIPAPPSGQLLGTLQSGNGKTDHRPAPPPPPASGRFLPTPLPAARPSAPSSPDGRSAPRSAPPPAPSSRSVPPPAPSARARAATSSSPELTSAASTDSPAAVSPPEAPNPATTSDIDSDWDDPAPGDKPAEAASESSAVAALSSPDKSKGDAPADAEKEAKASDSDAQKSNGAARALESDGPSLEVEVDNDDDESEKTTLYAQPVGDDDDDEEPTFVGDKSKANGAEKSDPSSAVKPAGSSLKPLPASLLSAPRTPPPPPPPTSVKSVPPPAPRSSAPRSVPPPRSDAAFASAASHAEVLPVSSTSPIALGRTTMPTFPPTSVVAPRRTGQIAALAVLVGGLLGLVIMLIARPNALALGSGGTGTLIVTVSGPGNAPVAKLTVFADDVSRCDSSPCRIAELKGGTHFVRVSAPGYEATAARAVSVNAGNEDTLHIQLSRSSESAEEPVKRAAAATPEPETRPAAPVRTEAPAVEAIAASRAPSAKLSVAPKAADKPAVEKPAADKAKAAGGNGKLNINSIPTANVVLDGRPVGRTPVVGLSVTPGAHTIVLIGPDGARRVTSADVAAGATRNVGVKF